MISLLVFLIFVPYISLPGLVYTSSYVQPLTVLLSWTIIFYKYHLHLNRSLTIYVSVFFGYLLISSLLLISPYTVPLLSSTSIVAAYFIGLLQFIFFSSLFSKCVFTNISSPRIYIQNVLLFLPLVIFLAYCIDYLFPGAFDIIKSKSDEISNSATLTTVYRGRSGLLPEPSYSGLLLSASFVTSFYLYASHNIYCNLNRIFNIQVYQSLLFSFLLTKRVQYTFLFSLLSVALSLSISSLISFLLPCILLFIPLIISFILRLKLSTSFLYLLLSSLILLVILILSINLLPQSTRLFKIFTILTSDFGNFLRFIFIKDQSGADRFNSLFLGLYPLTKVPFTGFGLGSYYTFFSKCTDSIVLTFNLMCDSQWNSTRNHNSFANFTQDFGLIGLSFLTFIPVYGFKLKLLSIPLPYLFTFVYLVLILIILPCPLGAPTSWSLLSAYCIFIYSLRQSRETAT